MDKQSEQHLIEQIQQAKADHYALNIIGGNSKSFYGRQPQGTKLNVNQHSGVVNYEPSELVITAKAGTKIQQIQALLSENNQMLGFEPPFCTENSTLGGVIAAGLSGPRRPFSGAVRDAVLGVKMINGNAQVLKFGGVVMKNVAGFDHSRLMAGSLGTLGVLLEVSIRVIPVAEIESTLTIAHDSADDAIRFFNQLAAKPFPISATAWYQGESQLRLSGTISAVEAAIKEIGGQVNHNANQFWDDLKNHQLPAFQQAELILRTSLPQSVNTLLPENSPIIEWNGAQRWLFDENITELNHQVSNSGGQLTTYKGGQADAEIFSKLDPVNLKLHQNIKHAFDPHGIFNPGRMYRDL